MSEEDIYELEQELKLNKQECLHLSNLAYKREQEIERLNKLLNTSEKQVHRFCEEKLTYKHEVKRLNNIINELERQNNIINDLDKFLKDKIDSWKKANDDLIVKDTIYHERLAVRLIYDYLQELKGDGSNEIVK